MISGAVYRDGVARTDQGAVYVFGLESTTPVPVAAVAGGKGVSPNRMKVTSDGAVYVRYR